MFRIVPALMLALFTSPLHAASTPVTEPGIARLEVNRNRMELGIKLYAAAEDLLGQGYAPNTPEERDRLNAIEPQMRAPNTLIELPDAADCVLSQMETQLKHWTRVAGDPAATTDGEPPQIQWQYSELSFNYRFLCANPEALQQAKILLFSRFPALHKIQVEMPNRPGSLQQLSADNDRLRF